MKVSQLDRRVRMAAWNIERLENRVLMSASVLSTIPTVNLTGGQSNTVTLSTFLGDPSITGGTVVEMQTPLGNIPLELTNSQTPLTVANFLHYITNGEYTPTIIQRSAPGFVLQGGGTKPDGSDNAPVSTLTSEAGISNTTGTIAMALSSGPNSGTNQWFINLADNASYLDGSNDGGPFTVFGNVIDGGMTIADNIAALPIINGSAENPNWYIGTDDGLPVINYSGSSDPTSVPQANLVTDNIVVIPAAQAAPTYTAVSSNTNLVTTSITNGVLSLHAPSSSASGTANITVTVTDLAGETANETFAVNVAAVPVVSTSNESGVGSAGHQISFPVTLSAASSSATTFDYSLSAGTAPSSDFSATANSGTIAAGSTTANILVNIPSDSTDADETFTLTLSSLSSNAVFSNGSSTLTAIGTIEPANSVLTATSTTLLASSSAVDAGASDTFTATVTSSNSQTAPTGQVTFDEGTTSLGTVALSNGTAVLTTPLDTAGGQMVTATYAGNQNFASSTSTAVSVDVAGSTTTALTASSASLAFGGAETLTATITPAVAGAQATGMVTFFNGNTSIGSVAVASNVAALAIDLNTAGNLSITATYSGDADDQSSTSAATGVVVASPSILTPTVAKSAIPTTGIAGQPFKASITISLDNASEIADQTGTVKVNLYATTDGEISPGSVLIGSISHAETIKKGKTGAVAVAIKSLPSSLVAGNYTLVAQAVDSSGLATTPVAGPTVSIAAPTIALVETFTKLDLPASVVAGSKTKAVAVLSIENTGNITSTGSTVIALNVTPDANPASGNPITQVTKNLTIKPAKAVTVSIPLGAYPSVSAAPYNIDAVVTDPKSNVTSVVSTSTVDIAPAQIDLDATALKVPATAALAKPISVMLSVADLGNVQAGGSLDVEFETSASASGTNPVEVESLTTTIKIQPGKTQVLHFKPVIPAGSSTGAIYLIAVVDPANVFSETDLINNTAISSSAINVG